MPPNLYLAPILTVGYVPKLNPHSTIYSLGTLSQLTIRSKSSQIVFYVVVLIEEIP